VTDESGREVGPGEVALLAAGAGRLSGAAPYALRAEVLPCAPEPVSVEVDGVAAKTSFVARDAEHGGGWYFDPPVEVPAGGKMTVVLAESCDALSVLVGGTRA
jgi:hypothetical protein